MINIQDLYIYRKMFVPKKDNKKNVYYDTILTLDIEVSSYFDYDTHYATFDFSKDKDYYKNRDKKSIMYIWQFGIENHIIFGRTYDELIYLLELLDELYPFKKIIYIHNLSYEFQFLLNCLNVDKVNPFARKARKVIKLNYEELGIEFRCSYTLTNMSLAKCAENFKLDVKKLVGNLDYNKSYTPITPLNDSEMDYCEHDIKVMYEFLKIYRERYGNVNDIPLTQTGEVRREVKKLFRNDRNYYKKIHNLVPPDAKFFKVLCDAFMGGYTHANDIYIDEIVENVRSKDLSSSYPTVMCCEKYPTSQFLKTSEKDYNKIVEKYGKTHCIIFELRIRNLESVKFNHILSASKCRNLKKAVEDNGRVVRCAECEITLTDVDAENILKFYKCELEVIQAYVAIKGYLDKKYVQYILELYQNKTSLKGINEDLYMKSKQFVNSLFGMMCTNTIRDEVIFKDGEWEKNILTEDDINAKLDKQRTSMNTFLAFCHGIWVTAYARNNLFKALYEIDFDAIYCDTDSIKYIDKGYDDFFENYNKEIINKLEKALETMEIDKSLIRPKDTKGVEHILGIFDDEGTYDKFVTLGAKKYCTEKDGKLSITLAGVNKLKGVKALKKIEDFTEGLIFDYDNSGRLIMSYYNDNIKFDVIDEYGNKYTCTDKYGINAMPTTYELGLSETFDDYLTNLANEEHERLSYLEKVAYTQLESESQ